MFILQASPIWMEAGQNIECVKIFIEKNLPETINASLGPTVWMLPILS